MKRHISYRHYRREFLRPLSTAHGEWSFREGFIVRVEEDGRVGFGEVAPIPDFGTETVDEARSFLKRLCQDHDLDVPDSLPCCAFGLSSARSGPPSDDHGFEVAALLPSGASALQIARETMAQGYHSLKWKVGVTSFVEEGDVFRSLVKILPRGIKLRLDANGGLSLGDAERWLNLLSPYSEFVEFIEQPLPPGREEAMESLCEGTGIPIALDESLNGPIGARWFEEWSGPLVIKPLLMGELSSLRARLTPVADRVVWSSSFESAFGLMNALSLMQDLPRSPFAIGFGTLGAFADDLAVVKKGPQLEVSAVSGLNLEALWEALS